MTECTPRSPDADVHARILDVPVSIAGLPPTLATGLEELLCPFLAGPDAEAASFRVLAEESNSVLVWNVYSADRLLSGFTDSSDLLANLEWRVAATALEASRECTLFHAAALTQNEKVLLLIGESGAGKTTLTLGLMARGWVPYADDIAVIDTATLDLQPFPRCFHVDETTQMLTAPASILDWPTSLPGYGRPRQWARAGLRPTALVLVSRDPQQPSVLTPIAQAEAAGALLQAGLRNQTPRPEVVKVSVHIAADLSWCGHLNNARLDESLDLLESI